jgi:type IV pilus assembly protein PilY1
MKTSSKYIILFVAACALALSVAAGSARAGDAWLDANGIRIDNVNLNGQHVTNNTYWIDPPFLSAKVRPNVLFVLDNSGSMNEAAYRSSYDPTQFVGGAYFGYFDPNTMYQYASNQWSPTTADTASATKTNPIAKGDFLNWAYMTKIEAAKKLMLGGKANPRSMSSGCCVKLTGENSASNFSKDYDNSLNAPNDMKIYPFAGNYRFRRNGSSLSITHLETPGTIYIYPTGDLYSNGTWTPTGAASNWQAVSEDPNDGNATRISNISTKDPVIFDYNYTGGSVGTIVSVTIQVVAKKSSSTQMNLQGVLQFTYSGTTNLYASSASALTTSYATYNIGSWTTNPATNLPWDWGDIKGVGTGALDGFGIQAVGNGNASPTSANYPTVTEVRLIIVTSSPDASGLNFTVDTGRTDVRGILDDLSTDARFGLAYYNTDNAGHIDTYVDFGAPTSMITSIGNLSPGTWTPLAETVYEMIGYFRQDAPYFSNNPVDYKTGQAYDPYYFQYTKVAGSGLADQYVPCAKSFILLMTDGEPTEDRNIPAWLQDYNGDIKDAPLCNNCSNFSHYLDDVAYYARQNDHRADLSGTQNIIIYPVFLFGKGSDLLMRTAIYGGYDDLDGNKIPSCLYPTVAGAPTQDELRECYRNSNNNKDASGNDILDPFDEITNPDGDLPLTYFQGDDGYELEVSIIDAITAILKRAASGTSVSVLGSSWKGEGSMYQAYFYPEKVEGLRRIKWTGYFHSLFVDRNGLIHEDTNGDGIMKPDDDYVVVFENQSGQDTKIKYFYDRVNNANPSDNHPDGIVDSSIPIKTIAITDVKPLWDAGKMLARRDPADRTIYTSLDADTAAPPATNPTLLSFDATNATNVTKMRPYLRVKTDAAAANLVNFVRGAVIPGWRDRQLTVDGTAMTWKLGDIVFSDPVVVAAPKERFDIVYNDKTYAEFYNKWAKRRGVVYVGGNDGMLHAFNTGNYISTTDSNPASGAAQITFCTTLDASDPTKCGPNDPNKALGKEMWGFIPPDVLPHLAWMADPDYQHTYFVDNMVRVTDARIFASDADHPNGWGTILLVSLRFGGGEIDVTDTFGAASTTKQFKSAYYCLDVTNPDAAPKLLWRFTDRELGFSLSTPTIVREEASGTDHWYAVMGSGPSNYRGARANDNSITNTKFTKSGVVAALPATTTMSTTNPHLYIVNLATGGADSSWTAGPGGRKGVIQDASLTYRFYTSVTAVDYPLDFKYDMIYYGSVGCNSGCSADGYGTWGGRVSRLKTYGNIDPGQWVTSDAFYTAQPITVKPAAGVDQRGNIWVYVGTGRFLHVDDRFDSTAEYYYGFKDSCYHSGCTSVIANGSNILNSSSFTVNVDGTITPTLAAGALGTGKPSANISRFDDLANFMRDQADGWKISLAAGERVIVNGFVVGGIAGFGSYTPTQTICEFEGRSKQFYPYYLTGTVPYIPGGTFMYSVSVDSGGGLPSIPAVHIDSAGNVKLFLQKSTGEIQVLEMKQAQTVTGGLGVGGECNY